MKVYVLVFAFLCSAIVLPAQGPFSIDEALKQLYHNYDPAKKTAQWECTKEQQTKESDRLCDYLEAGALKDVSVSVLLTAQVPEGDVTRVYLATSAEPAEFDCHACIPATGAAAFVWQGQRWILESANVAAAYLGGWGEAPRTDLITIGPQKHGLLLSSTDMGQGYVGAIKQLLAPIGKSVEEIWSLKDDDDDSGSIDPDDKLLAKPVCRASAAFRFLAGDEESEGTKDYYDIEVISRGSSWQDYDHPVKRENWAEIYTFKDGKYRLARKTAFIEAKKSGNTTKK